MTTLETAKSLSQIPLQKRDLFFVPAGCLIVHRRRTAYTRESPYAAYTNCTPGGLNLVRTACLPGRQLCSADVFFLYFYRCLLRPIMSECTGPIFTKFSGLVDIVIHLTFVFNRLRVVAMHDKPVFGPNWRNRPTSPSFVAVAFRNRLDDCNASGYDDLSST